MTLLEYLSVPYLLEAYSVERQPDLWTRHVSYPELPDCVAEAEELEDAIEQLERTRIRKILRMLHEGKAPPIPRQPLSDCDPVGLSRQLGIEDEIMGLLDRDEAGLRRLTKQT